MQISAVKWKFGHLLKHEGVTVYKLSQHVEPKVSRVTLYRWRNEAPERVSLEAMGHVLRGLEQLTGKRYTVSDLLEYEAVPEPLDGETRAWLDADLAAPLEPYDWGEVDPATLGKPIHYEPSVGFVVEGAPGWRRQSQIRQHRVA